MLGEEFMGFRRGRKERDRARSTRWRSKSLEEEGFHPVHIALQAVKTHVVGFPQPLDFLTGRIDLILEQPSSGPSEFFHLLLSFGDSSAEIGNQDVTVDVPALFDLARQRLTGSQ